MVLGVFLAAFAGLIAGPPNHARPDTAASTGASSSEIAHLSKREPSRFVVADIRRDGVPVSTFDDGGGFLPPSTLRLLPRDTSGGLRAPTPSRAAGASASSFDPRAPPSAA